MQGWGGMADQTGVKSEDKGDAGDKIWASEQGLVPLAEARDAGPRAHSDSCADPSTPSQAQGLPHTASHTQTAPSSQRQVTLPLTGLPAPTLTLHFKKNLSPSRYVNVIG